MLADDAAWFTILQAHVTAVQANDTAVRLCREGQLDEAIAALQGGLAANSPYATGYSNLGFLYLRKGQLDQAVECLLHALEVDPRHKDAPEHLVDVLSALIDELVRIGFSDGFLALQPGGTFDDHNRHIRTRELGALLAKIGASGVFTVNGRALESVQLLAIIARNVQQKMRYHHHSFSLKCVWEGLGEAARAGFPGQSSPGRLD
jgi:tetratricopeptide (TPR) repeat protein